MQCLEGSLRAGKSLQLLVYSMRLCSKDGGSYAGLRSSKGPTMCLSDWKIKYHKAVAEVQKWEGLYENTLQQYTSLCASYECLVSKLMRASIRKDIKIRMLAKYMLQDPRYSVAPLSRHRSDILQNPLLCEPRCSPPGHSIRHPTLVAYNIPISDAPYLLYEPAHYGAHDVKGLPLHDPQICTPMSEGKCIVSPTVWEKSSSNVEKRVKKIPCKRMATTLIGDEYVIPLLYGLPGMYATAVDPVIVKHQCVGHHIFYHLDASQREQLVEFASRDFNSIGSMAVRWRNGKDITVRTL